MKTKIIRSGEKGFEVEKAKMFKAKYEPRVLTKEEQLRLVFSHLFASILAERFSLYDIDENKLIKKYTNIFLTEVKIRVDLK